MTYIFRCILNFYGYVFIKRYNVSYTIQLCGNIWHIKRTLIHIRNTSSRMYKFGDKCTKLGTFRAIKSVRRYVAKISLSVVNLRLYCSKLNTNFVVVRIILTSVTLCLTYDTFVTFPASGRDFYLIYLNNCSYLKQK